MITLAGHGKDERLVQVELPIVPNVGDLIREDANSPAWEKKIESLITEGEFVEIVEKYESIFWKARLSNGKFALMAPEDTVIIDRAPVLVEKEVNQSLPEQSFKVGDRVYQDNPDNSGTITKISRGKAVVDVGCDRTVTVPLAKINHCDPNYSPKPKKSAEEILAEEEAAIAKARDEYLKSQVPLESIFKVGDRVTHANELLRNGIKADFGTVTEKRFDKRKKITWVTVSWDDGTICKSHVEGAGTLKAIKSESFKVGDRIKDRDGFIGVITSVSDRCINVENEKSIKSYNLEKGSHTLTILEASEPLPLLPEIAVQPIKKPDAIAIPLRITENRELYDLLLPICNWYCGKYLPTFAVNALGHALDNARQGKIAEAVALLPAEVMAEIAKPKQDVTKLKAFLTNFIPSIDAIELPLFEDAIATEPTQTVANLRMDEGSISVLVEIDPVLVEKDRYQFLLERREQLIESGASPQGVWINCGKVPNRDFKQAVWKSDKPQPQWGGKKSQYIGRQGGDEHLSAIAQHRAGQELRKIEREIKKLQVKS